MKKKRFSAEQIVATLKQAKLAAVYKISENVGQGNA
jgi:hypothetical protein